MNGTRQLNCAYMQTHRNFEWVCMAGCCYFIIIFFFSPFSRHIQIHNEKWIKTALIIP